MSTDRTPPIHKTLTLSVLAVACAVRLLHLFFTTRFNPLAAYLQLDAAIYDRWARVLVLGGEIGPTRLMQAPLYPWFLSLIYRFAGVNLTAVRLVQALLGTASTLLIVLITRKLFRSTAASIIAGAVAALYLPLIFYEGILLPVTLIVFLNLLLVQLLEPGDTVPGNGRLLLAGVVLGLSVVAKPIAILLWPFAFLHILLRTGRARGTESSPGETPGGHEREKDRDPQGKGTGGRRSMHSLRHLLVFSAGVVIAIAPLTIRNAVLTHEFVPLTTGGGINFYIGNNPEATGFYSVPFYKGQPIGGTPEEQQKKMYDLASAETGRTLSPREVSNFWLRRGLEYNRDNPGAFVRRTWQKLLLFWNNYERANVESLPLHRRITGILQLPLFVFGIIAPFAVVGIFLMRSRMRFLWLLYGGIISYCLAGLAFYVLARYRLPVVVFLLPFTGACITELISLITKKQIGELILVGIALGLLFYFINMTVAIDTPFGISKNLTRLGNAYIARGDTAAAVEVYREAVDVFPQNGDARRALRLITSE
ncbi:MAG: glycosyltransferase family 39 protein [bacterium]|nr:MAG: glycosyltransferase family 39 protein [bacterium]